MISIELPRQYLERAINSSIASLNRSISKQPNPMIKDMIQKDIAIYQTALNTMKEKP